MSAFEDVFCDAEEQAFGFLATEHGFRAVAREVDRVHSAHGVFGRAVYQSGTISPGLGRKVELYIAPLRLELDLEVSGHGYGPYTIEELHALDGEGLFPGREHGLYDAMHNPEELLASSNAWQGPYAQPGHASSLIPRSCGRLSMRSESARPKMRRSHER